MLGLFTMRCFHHLGLKLYLWRSPYPLFYIIHCGEYVTNQSFQLLSICFRLWPRRYWLVIFESFFSLVEAAVGQDVFSLAWFNVSFTYCIIVGAIALPYARIHIYHFQGVVNIPEDLILGLHGLASLIMSTLSLLTFAFLLYDLFNDRGKNFLCPYDFSIGLCPPDDPWSFISGKHATKKRFRCVSRSSPYHTLCPLCPQMIIQYRQLFRPDYSRGNCNIMFPRNFDSGVLRCHYSATPTERSSKH